MLSVTLALLGCSSEEGSDPGDDDQGIGSTMRELSEPLLESRARGTALGGNATGTHGCTEEGRYDHYEELPAEGATQLHVIGIGEAGEGGLQETGEPIEEGEIDIHLKRAGTSILVLSASGRAHWKVTVEPGATLERVILSGGYAQRATVPDGVPVDALSGERTRRPGRLGSTGLLLDHRHCGRGGGAHRCHPHLVPRLLQVRQLRDRRAGRARAPHRSPTTRIPPFPRAARP